MKLRMLTACLFALVATSAATATAQSKLDFTLLNRTGLTVNELYVTPTHADDWEEDILGKDVLKHGENTDIVFSRSEKSCMWDLKIVDEDGDSVEWTNLDFCKAAQITLMYENGKPTAIVK